MQMSKDEGSARLRGATVGDLVVGVEERDFRGSRSGFWMAPCDETRRLCADLGLLLVVEGRCGCGRGGGIGCVVGEA